MSAREEEERKRAEQAAQEFVDHGLHYVTCRHADVCADGWAYPGLAESSVDAVIFDLPQPWDAVPRWLVRAATEAAAAPEA